MQTIYQDLSCINLKFSIINLQTVINNGLSCGTILSIGFIRLNKYNRVFPPLAVSIFCRFYGMPFTTHMKKNITYVVQWLYKVKLSNLKCVVLTTSVKNNLP